MTTVQLTLILANIYIAASMAHENSRGATLIIGLFWLLATSRLGIAKVIGLY